MQLEIEYDMMIHKNKFDLYLHHYRQGLQLCKKCLFYSRYKRCHVDVKDLLHDRTECAIKDNFKLGCGHVWDIIEFLDVLEVSESAFRNYMPLKDRINEAIMLMRKGIHESNMKNKITNDIMTLQDEKGINNRSVTKLIDKMYEISNRLEEFRFHFIEGKMSTHTIEVITLILLVDYHKKIFDILDFL